ncbi:MULTISPECIES: 30S ribosomal protein S20 [Halorhodospira]|uniref:30S ribosomal protein S20 n=1 Tax=Halorhodospira TaxID=85108 RepID=UPI001EE7DD65|nr:30S ribosomal protein S20 [Halorhodospira halophila]MCG5532717.1 30S ribosomal protein S20 [Halorhodospira sp. 9621]MCG5537763.1 30S ribosomal protein S20 [Halorhodospira sp. 9622]MCG5539888.1 30S ribosomal protein S20 [Halorhodospira sp. M39old]MCG5542409.1 30S ribosomal protein S20 [Halorhodospira sp. 9628]MCG5545276.1 30S ribosomal protein S20 [Halorhodospira sp. M38]
MANIASAKKRARQAEERRLRNKSRRSEMRTSMKKVLKAVKTGDHDQAQQAYRSAVRVIDRSANRGIIHKNKAARHKSRLNAKVRSLAG